MVLTLRRLDAADWRALRAVRLQALADQPGSFFRSLAEDEAEPDDHWRAMLTRPTAALWGAFDGDRMVGLTGAFTDRDDPSGMTAAFGMTWLDPAYRGRGVSRLCYEARIGWARARGYARIHVGHRASNAASAAAMRRAGFRPIRREPHLWPDGMWEDDVIYELLLTSPTA
jgi:RimJ/RimL family protein N-acetyltransferase